CQQQAWQCRILFGKGDVRERDSPDGVQRITRPAGRAIDDAQQACTNPVHDSDPDRAAPRSSVAAWPVFSYALRAAQADQVHVQETPRFVLQLLAWQKTD